MDSVVLVCRAKHIDFARSTLPVSVRMRVIPASHVVLRRRIRGPRPAAETGFEATWPGGPTD